MINGIVAVERSHGIGRNGTIPWPRLSNDMKWFRDLTTNHIVVMGSTTWNSIKKPLPNRINIVMSSKSHVGADYSCINIDEALELCNVLFPEKEIFIIGGQALYNSVMSDINKFYITEIDENYECDKFFDVKYVQTRYSQVVEHAKYTDPIPYTIKEYKK